MQVAARQWLERTRLQRHFTASTITEGGEGEGGRGREGGRGEEKRERGRKGDRGRGERGERRGGSGERENTNSLFHLNPHPPCRVSSETHLKSVLIRKCPN